MVVEQGAICLKKNGEVTVVRIPAETDMYFKSCGFKKAGGFLKLHTYDIGDRSVEIWGRNQGAEKSISKWELPPPLDVTFAYGNQLAIVHDSAGNICKISKDDWDQLYEKMFGGFDDIGADDSERSEDELEDCDPSELTKEGYLKDGFVVSGDELDEVGTEEYE